MWGEGDLRTGEALITEGNRGGDNGLEEELENTQAVEECVVGGGEFWMEEDEKELVIEEGENWEGFGAESDEGGRERGGERRGGRTNEGRG